METIHITNNTMTEERITILANPYLHIPHNLVFVFRETLPRPSEEEGE